MQMGSHENVALIYWAVSCGVGSHNANSYKFMLNMLNSIRVCLHSHPMLNVYLLVVHSRL
jgi:hypothetical protein